MSNLLLENDKKAMKRDYFLRLTAVTLFLAAFVTFIGSVLLLPSLFLVEAKKSTLVRQAELEQLTSVEDGNPYTVVRKTEEKLDLLARNREREEAGELLTIIVEEKPLGVRLTSIVYSRQGASGGSFTVSGVATDRGALIDFSKRLERNQHFAEVILPVSNLASNRDILFSLSMKSVQ